MFRKSLNETSTNIKSSFKTLFISLAKVIINKAKLKSIDYLNNFKAFYSSFKNVDKKQCIIDSLILIKNFYVEEWRFLCKAASKLFKDLLIRVKSINKQTFINLYSNIKGLSYNLIVLIKKSFTILKKLDKNFVINTFKQASNKAKQSFKNICGLAKFVKSLDGEDILNIYLDAFYSLKDYIARNSKKILKITHIAAPIVSILILFSTIIYFNNVNYALVLAYDGKKVAAMQSEEIIEQATQMVNERIQISDSKENEIELTVPTYKVAVVKTEELATPVTVCDKIIEQSKGAIEEANGLYVDDQLIAAVKEDNAVEELLNDYLPKEEDKEISFVENVQVVKGLYPTNNIVDKDELKQIIDTPIEGEEFYTVQNGDAPLSIAAKFNLSLQQLIDLNYETPIEDLMFEGKKVKVSLEKKILNIKVMITNEYETSIPYQTIKTKDDSKFTDYSEVTKNGEEGIAKVVERVTFINGNEESKELISKEIIKEPINKEVVVGTKKKSKSKSYQEGNGKSYGSLMWPVPYTQKVTSGFGPRWGTYHYGIDIASRGVYGKDIVAADGGTVSSVNRGNSGYGNYLIVQHGNGLSTLYAHCSEINVSKGQKVSKGQPIAKVGKSGQVTGPHLHFEVMRNGKKENPRNFV